MQTVHVNNEQRLAWDNIAKGYDKYVTDSEEWLANKVLNLADLKPGQTLLDVAAGCGGLSLPAARLGAKVVATDWSPEMIRLFEARVQKENLDNAVGKIMDGHHLEFDDNHFDLVVSLFGVMLLPDQPRALREMVRVAKPGGKVLTVGYGTPDKILRDCSNLDLISRGYHQNRRHWSFRLRIRKSCKHALKRQGSLKCRCIAWSRNLNLNQVTHSGIGFSTAIQ